MSKEVRLGAFIFVALVVLFAEVFLVGDLETRFQKTYKIRAQFDNVAGLNPGADVRIGGIHKGTVRTIDLPKKPDGKVTIVMDLQAITHDVIREDSHAAIKSEGLLGDKYVEVTFGSTESPQLKDGGMIASDPPLDISDIVAKADHLLDSTGETADNMKEIVHKINDGQGSIGALINDKTVFNNASKATANLQEDTEALKHNFLTKGFFKNRGYEDSADLKKDAIAKLPAGAPEKIFSYGQNQIFDKPDNAKLKNEKSLAEAGKYLESNPFGSAVVVAYGGGKGDSDKLKTLSEGWSYAVRNYLVQNYKFDDKKLRTLGMGKSETADESARIEIRIYATDPVKHSAQ